LKKNIEIILARNPWIVKRLATQAWILFMIQPGGGSHCCETIANHRNLRN